MGGGGEPCTTNYFVYSIIISIFCKTGHIISGSGILYVLEYTVNTHWNILSVTVNKSIPSFIHSASSAKLHYSLGSILICYSSFLVFWKKTSLPPLENRFLVLHKYSTCKDYLVTNQFNSNEFDMCNSIIMKVVSSVVLLLCTVVILYVSVIVLKPCRWAYRPTSLMVSPCRRTCNIVLCISSGTNDLWPHPHHFYFPLQFLSVSHYQD